MGSGPSIYPLHVCIGGAGVEENTNYQARCMVCKDMSLEPSGVFGALQKPAGGGNGPPNRRNRNVKEME